MFYLWRLLLEKIRGIWLLEAAPGRMATNHAGTKTDRILASVGVFHEALRNFGWHHIPGPTYLRIGETPLIADRVVCHAPLKSIPLASRRFPPRIFAWHRLLRLHVFPTPTPLPFVCRRNNSAKLFPTRGVYPLVRREVSWGRRAVVSNTESQCSEQNKERSVCASSWEFFWRQWYSACSQRAPSQLTARIVITPSDITSSIITKPGKSIRLSPLPVKLACLDG